MKKVIFSLLFIFYCALACPIYFKHIGVKDGLSQLSVLSIHQDKLGRIWFGTMEGLSIYNGSEVVSYKGANALPRLTIEGEKITNITENKEGNIFFMTNDKGLMKYDLKQHKFSTFEGLEVSALSSIDGTIYIASKDTIYTWDELTNSFSFKLAPIISNKITKIFKDHQQQFWIGTLSGLYKLLPDNTPVCVIPDKEIWQIFESSHNELWIGTRMEGMYKIDSQGTVTAFTHNPKAENGISSNQVRTFVEDSDGNIWIGTFGGLNKYERKTGRFSLYINNYTSGSLAHSSIFSLFIDRQGSFWIGSYYGGVNFFNPKKDVFTYYGVDPLRDNSLNYPFVGNMVEDKDHNVWICTEGGGLNMLDRKRNRFKYYTADNGGNGPNHNNLKSICYDSLANKLYMGTHTGGISSYDISDGKFRNFLNEPSKDGLFHSILLQTVFYKGDLYFQDTHGLFKMDGKTGNIIPLYPAGLFDKYSGISFIIDSKGYLWISTFRNYIARLNLNDPKEEIKEYYFEEKFSTARSLTLFESKSGDIYVTTLGLGLLKLDIKNGAFTSYTSEKGQLLSNYCYNVAESHLGHLIVIGDKGLSILNTNKRLIKSISISRLLPISSFNRGNAILVCENGEIFVSTTEGLISFFEEDLYSPDPPYNLYFSNLMVNNKEVLPDDGSYILDDIFAYTSKISLKHNQNNLMITFAGNDYATAYNPRLYEYKLEGLDNHWITTNKASLVYTHLTPGEYTLRVRSHNTYNTDNLSDEIQLEIIVHAPFYATSFAWIVYMLLFASLLYAFIYFRQRQIRLEASLQYERKEKQYITTLNKAKLSFFTKISHEFRTPLTLIITQIELLMQGNTLSKSVSDRIQKIYKNSYRMRNLVNEILDFQKMEDVRTQLHIYHADLIPILNDIFSSFKEKAQSKEIKYNFESSSETLFCWFDPEQLQKVFYNLLSNAFSYTPAKGTIELIVLESADKITVKVIDNGVGIDKADIKNIFDQFYQASNNIKAEDPYLTTGMGLAICKEIVEFHHGTMSVESKPDYGSIFIVTLKKGVEHFEKDSNVKIIRDGYEAVKEDTLPAIDFIGNESEDNSEVEDAPMAKLYTILIVEDNEELSELLESIFSPFYKVLIAYNGKEALRIVMDRDSMPDIILSDIMMPEMDGTELCMRIKNNINTSHIPVVLLTAKTSDEQNLEGLQKGADDYIMKPFNAKILLTRCNNLIQNRLRLQETFRKQDSTDIQLLANNTLDQNFLKKIEKVIDDNLNNPEFDINTLAREMAMGRSSLFAKFKILTGIGPNEFILNYKLKRAAFMLRNNTNLQINDVADEFGFSSARYFSRCFKLQFNMSPNEYRKKEDDN
ncbi:signal transduction histidine kinase [Dysgonomonas alginatilytica]|uniref:histidine kinase n=1 Tax=Dysgonomonas alginatilytica TaxID=1605892 RepID=A0A2V3PQF9_9BACT|nr:hybrid sensor histidine kinase/response regulator transcription factor [Dysgonomonas alginatilytica]PXV65912.1 signal transduction histidine kinase [Dysgonomonas alginatilytica]